MTTNISGWIQQGSSPVFLRINSTDWINCDQIARVETYRLYVNVYVLSSTDVPVQHSINKPLVFAPLNMIGDFQ